MKLLAVDSVSFKAVFVVNENTKITVWYIEPRELILNRDWKSIKSDIKHFKNVKPPNDLKIEAFSVDGDRFCYEYLYYFI
jgi:hypothetical protein